MRFVDISNWKADVDVSRIDADGVVVQCTWGAGELTTGNGIVESVWTGATRRFRPPRSVALRSATCITFVA